MTNSDSRLIDLGWSDYWAATLAEHPGHAPGRVARRDRGRALVLTEGSPVWCDLTGDSLDATVGDWVAMTEGEPPKILTRRSLLRRKGSDGAVQPLAANVDTVLLVCGLDRPVKPGRINRGAVQAWDAGARPVVVLNKADLSPDSAAAAAELSGQIVGMNVLVVSSKTGEGLDALRELIRNGTSVLLGESGAGKSSLLNYLAGTELSPVGEVRPGDSKGRHTTTHRELHILPGPAVIIDSPGIRSLGLVATEEAIQNTFDDIDQLSASCFFADCGHETEPGCAVREAVEEGVLQPARLDSYLQLRNELANQVLRTLPHERRKRERDFSKMAREAQRSRRRRRGLE